MIIRIVFNQCKFFLTSCTKLLSLEFEWKKSSQHSRTFLSIPVDFSCAGFPAWPVSYPVSSRMFPELQLHVSSTFGFFSKVHILIQFLVFLYLDFVVCLDLLRISCVIFSRTYSILCICHLVYGQILFACTVLKGSPSPPNHACSFVPVFYIRLLCSLLFCLCFHLACICSSPEYYLFELSKSFLTLFLEDINCDSISVFSFTQQTTRIIK